VCAVCRWVSDIRGPRIGASSSHGPTATGIGANSAETSKRVVETLAVVAGVLTERGVWEVCTIAFLE
jgi:hypothetical protein